MFLFKRSPGADDAAYVRQQAYDFCTQDTVATFRKDGFVRLKNCVSEKLCDDALREINRRLGSNETSVDEMKARTFPKHKAITNLFNKSAIPIVLQKMLGGKKPYRQGGGQLALRFPGDFTPNQSAKASEQVFRNTAQYWHIDGCPNDFIPGITDHYGKIHNFDCLVGVLLSDVDAPLSGELCTFPGSHHELAEYFSKGDNLERVYQFGNQALPTGKATWKIFKRKPCHCTGKKGDVFLANYLTAHFVAPNASPSIRYAVYFRVTRHGAQRVLPNGKHNPAPLLDPWVNWAEHKPRGEQEGKAKGNNGAVANYVNNSDGADVFPPPSEEELELMKLYEQLANNDHTAPPSLQKKNAKDKNGELLRKMSSGSHDLPEEKETKVAVVISMLHEMGLNDKTYDDVVKALKRNNWEENNALGSFF